MTIRKNVLNALIDSSLTQKEICEGAGITQATLSRAMNFSYRKPQIKTVEKVKRFFKSKNMEWI